jgi:competence protein ComEC
MGDASTISEKDIMKRYNLSHVNLLKVGHHGSNTSSSIEFINKINPSIALISVGKNNKFGHPKQSVLDILNHSKILRTDIDGSIEIAINKNGYKMITYLP